MTGAELLKARYILGLSQASVALLMGNQITGTTGFTATDIITAEGAPGTISNTGLNQLSEKFLRPTLNAQGGGI